MGKNHLKRLNVPDTWSVRRKGVKFVARPKSGKHDSEFAIGIGVLLRDHLNYAETMKEVKLMLNNEKVLINGRRVFDYRFNCGLFDILEFEKTGERFLVLNNKFNRYIAVEWNSDASYAKIKRKSIIGGAKYSLGLSNGYNVLVDKKKFDSVSRGDTVMYDFKKSKIQSVVNFKEGVYAYVYRGNHVGLGGKVKEIVKFYGMSPDEIKIDVDGQEVQTSRENCFAISNNKKDVEVLTRK